MLTEVDRGLSPIVFSFSLWLNLLLLLAISEGSREFDALIYIAHILTSKNGMCTSYKSVWRYPWLKNSTPLAYLLDPCDQNL